jgi:NhaA family Na+:H+ antiporter
VTTGPPEPRLLRPIDRRRDHVRGQGGRGERTVVVYGDFLCPYCRRLRAVLQRLRESLGERLAYVFRHFPNERAHPGAELLAIASEAASRQGRFWDLYDALYSREPPIGRDTLMELARGIGLDMAKFEKDLADPALKRRVEQDLADGRANGVTGTPTLFVDGLRYDGAWDFQSMLEALERPLGAQVQRSARAFANLPTSAGLVLLIAAAAALVFANTSLAPLYRSLVGAEIGLGPPGAQLSLSVGEWCSEGLLAVFFLILGLEIRRELTSGSLTDPRAAAAPVLAAIGGTLVPALIYLAFNPGPTRAGWPAPTDTGVAFVLAVLAVFGSRVSADLKVFVAAYAVADDVISILVLAIFYPHALHPEWLLAAVGVIGAMVLLSRGRVYAAWPYVVATLGLWLCLHLAGVGGALAGVALAALLPPRHEPNVGPLLAQAATALSELEHAEKELKRAGEKRRLRQEPVWDFASRNLTAAAQRLLSPAERAERTAEPWSTYLILPLFAFTASGVSLAADLSAPDAWRVFLGAGLGLWLGKPLGVALAVWGAARARLAVLPAAASPLAFVAAAMLCGIADPLSLLMADKALPEGYAAIAKIGLLAASLLSAVFGGLVLVLSGSPATSAQPADSKKT